MNLRDLVEGEDSLTAIDELMHLLKHQANAVFIGAGASISAGYRNWKDVIHGNSEKPGLIDFTQNKNDHISKDFLEVAQLCFEQNPNGYRRFLLSEFGDKNRTFSDIIYLLSNLKLMHYVTTNFDKCLLDTVVTTSINSYPIFNHYIPPPPIVTYLHGRAFILKNETEEQLDYFLDNIVFRNAVYRDAYSNDGNGDGACRSFIQRLLEKYNLIFIGFSFMDALLMEVIKIFLEQSENQHTKSLRYRSDYPDSRKKVFVFRASTELSDNDRLLMRFGNVRLIVYRSDGSDHSNLREIIHNINVRMHSEQYPGSL